MAVRETRPPTVPRRGDQPLEIIGSYTPFFNKTEVLQAAHASATDTHISAKLGALNSKVVF